MGWRDYMDDGNQFKPYAVPKTQPNETGWRAYMPKPEYQSAPDKYRQNEIPQPNKDATALGGLWQSLKTNGGNAASSSEYLTQDSEQRKFTDALETLQRVKSGDGSLLDSVKGFSLGARYGGGNTDDAIEFLSKQVVKSQQAKDAQAAKIDARNIALQNETPIYDSKIGNWAYGGLQSFTGQAPAMAMSFLTRSPTPMLANAGLATGLPKTVEARRAGYSPSDAAKIGIAQGGTEVLTELIPAGTAVKGAFGKMAIGKALKKEFVSDAIGENIAAITQGAIDTKTGLGGTEKGNWRQYLQNLPDAMGQATVGSLTGSSVTGLPMYATNRLVNGKPQPKSFTKADLQPQTPPMQVPQINKSAPLVGAIRKAGGVGTSPSMSGLDALGSLISRGEGNYNSFNSGTKGVSGGVIGHSGQRNLSAMSVSDILNTDGLSGNDKNRVFAAGKYQITIPTLRGAVKALGLNGSEKFTPQLQERIFNEYLIHKAGGGAVTRYLNGTGSLRDAQIGLAQEWRSFADPRTGRTYSDSGAKANKASISADESARILTAIKNGGDLSSFMAGNQSIDSQPFDTQTTQFDSDSALQDYQDELQSQLEEMQAAQEQAYADQQDEFDTRVSELQDKLDALQGADTEIEVNGKYEPSQWMIQEADSLGATIDKADNQLRDRNRLASEVQINEMANNLDHRKLMDSPMMDYGAPTLANDGATVIGGNGRVAAIKRAYEQGKANTYREQIKANAGRFGFTPEQVAQYKKPVLTRRFKNFVDTQKAAIASNEGGGLSMSALEQTKVDASRLPPLSAFTTNETGELNTAANRDAIRAFVGAFPTNQQAALIGSDGQLSQSGVARLRNAILHKAYGDSDTLGRMVESTDQGSRNIVNALTQSAPNVADVKDGIAKGELHNADITDDVLQAVEILNQIKADGGTIRAYLSQHNLLDEHMSVAARKLLRFFDANLNSAKKIRELIGAYNDALRAQGNPNQGDVFGDKVTVDKNQLLDKVLKDHGQQQSELDNSGQSARYEQSIGAPVNETQGRPDSSNSNDSGYRAGGEQGQSERGRINGERSDLTLTGQTEAEIAHTEAQIKLVEKQRELAEKKLEAQRAQDELQKTVAQRNDIANDTFELGQSAEDNISGQGAMFSRANNKPLPEKIKVDGIERHTTNSNGKPIHTTEDGVRNFWRWFGESKVVDADGRPVVVYHGTTENFNSFNINYFGKTDSGFAGKGFYFTNNAEIASHYATDSVWVLKDKVVDGGNVVPSYIKLENPYVTDVYDISDEPLVGYITTKQLMDNGHDGVVVTDPSGTYEYVVYGASQIKSATGNDGSFNADNHDIRFSRSADTKAKYDARIDELFNGGKANLHGVTVLNKSDVLDMLGYGGKPVNLAESKVVMGMSNHPLMTADVWKKIPEWIENPAAVFESDTETNRLVFIAPELVRNKPVRIILIPDGGQLKAHVLLNAYDAYVSMPWKRWVSDGLMKYVDMKKAQSVLDGSNLNVALPSNRQNLSSQYPKSFQSQLTGMLSKYQGRARILTEKNLAGYRKSQQSVNSSNDVGQKTTGNTVSAIRQNIAKMFGEKDLSGLSNINVMQTATPDVLSKIEDGKFSQIGNETIQGAYDPKTGKIFMFADAIPQGQERGVFLHEVFHKRGRELMGEHYSRLKSFVDGWANAKVGTVERDIYEAAKARAEASGETGTRYDDELIAYAIEESVNRGVEPQAGDLGKTTAQGFMARVRQLFTNVMKKMQPSFNGKFTAEDMVTIAHAAAGLEFANAKNDSEQMSAQMSAQNQNEFTVAPESKTQRAIRQHVDSMNRLTDVEKSLKEHGIDLIVDASSQAVAYHGRLTERLNDFREKTVKQLLAKMSEHKVSPERADWYLLARHAVERNAQIAKINDGLPDGGSGMTNQQARDLLTGKSVTMNVQTADEHGKVSNQSITVDGFTQSELSKLHEVGTMIDAMTAENRKLMVGYGLESAQDVAGWAGMYRHYVPLAGMAGANEFMGIQGVQSGFSVRGGQKRAMGRTSVAPNILEQVLRQREDVLMRGEKNLVARTFVVNTKEAMSGAQMPMTASGKPLYELNPSDMKPYMKNGKVEWHNVPDFMGRNIVTARVNGKDVVVRINDNALAEAVRNLDAPQMGELLKWWKKGTSTLSMLYTGANPAFWAKAFIRDIWSVATLGQRYGLTGQTLKRIPKALQIAFASEFNSRAGRDKENPLWREFRTNGGRTGFIESQRDLGEKRASIQRELLAMGDLTLESAPEKLKQAMGHAMDWLTYVGSSFESGVRFAAYTAAKDKGLNPLQASNVAKEITLNFNRKGASKEAQVLNTMFVFYNASVQGVRTQAIGLQNKRVVMSLVPVVALAAMGQALSLAAIGDDDERDLLLNNPQFQRDRTQNIIIPTGNSERPYLKIPLPPDLYWVAGIGATICDGIYHDKNSVPRALDAIGQSFGKSFLPPPIGDVVASAPWKNGGKVFANAAPTLIKPLAQSAVNVNFTGAPLMPENAWDDTVPDSQKAWRRTDGSWASSIAINLSNWTGGDKRSGGLIDVSPETIKNVVQTYTGGVGSFLTKGWDAIDNPKKGALDAPILADFIASPDALERGNSSRVSQIMGEANDLKAQLKGYVKDGNKERAAEVRKQLNELTGGDMSIEYQRKAYNKQDNQLRKNDASSSVRDTIADRRAQADKQYLMGLFKNQ